MKKSDYFSSGYLTAQDITKPVHVTISAVQEETMRDGERKPVLYFRNAKKGLTLNLTRWNQLEQIAGSESPADWIGADVVVKTIETTFRGQPTKGIALESPRRQQPAQPQPDPQAPLQSEPGATEPEDDLNDSIPF